MNYEQELNNIWNKSGYSSPNNIPVSDIIHLTQPKTDMDLYCAVEKWCKENGKRTIEELAADLHKIYKNYSYSRFTEEQLYRYGLEIFVTKAFLGFEMERTATKLIKDTFTDFELYSDPQMDTEYRVDFFVLNTESVKFIPVQVKPASYKYIPQAEKQSNINKNNEFLATYAERLVYPEVYYLYYKKDGSFTNKDELISIIENNLK